MSTQTPPQYYAVDHTLLIEVLNHLAKEPAANLYSRLNQLPKVNIQTEATPTPTTPVETPTPQV
jgi:hypothetical protein